MSDRGVWLSEDECTKILGVLEEVVVSLDQLGSRHAGGRDMREALWDYFSATGDHAWKRLSDARYVLVIAAERELGTETVGSWLQDQQYWADVHPNE